MINQNRPVIKTHKAKDNPPPPPDDTHMLVKCQGHTNQNVHNMLF